MGGSIRWGVWGLALLAAGCASLPPQEGRVPSAALEDTSGTQLALAVGPVVAAHPGKTGIHPLFDPRDAFAARALLAAAAGKSIDAQYYIWHGDTVGNLVFQALRQAADRGVRVRLLLDDMNTAGLDPVIAALDAHPDIEVRLYNPFPHRGSRALDFLSDFSRLNRRMHNKSFTVDNRASVVGGRNIGNEYFGVGEGTVFADLDVVAVGAAVRDVSRQFDLYWNSAPAYPAASFVAAAAPADLDTRFAATRADPASVAYLEALRTTALVRDLLARRLPLEWTDARLVHDDPAKTLDSAPRADVLLFPALVDAIGRPEKSLDLVSPYFVPGDEGTEALAALARRGVSVRVLTNSLESSEANVVHAGYAKRREALLRAGVRLYELKAAAGEGARGEKAGMGSSSGAALHAKTFAVDAKRIFVGSFNFDLRSALINTEMGLVISSPALAGRLAGLFDEAVPLSAYEARLRADGTLEWIERTAEGEKRHESEPGAGWFRRFAVGVLSALPIDWML
ncbi:MAG TPA: phospholipase D family protein [Usitatibacteraceae bacterium]|nr:phospholipase D family protein [Usitatibacteraceae bacterium]